MGGEKGEIDKSMGDWIDERCGGVIVIGRSEFLLLQSIDVKLSTLK